MSNNNHKTLLDLMTMTSRFNMESGISKFEKDIHNNVLVNLSHFLCTF